MQKYIFSADKNAFFPCELKIAYQESGEWPGDGIEIDDTVCRRIYEGSTRRKIQRRHRRMPAWIDIHPPLMRNKLPQPNWKKQQLINQVNEYINSKQWPGKAAIGRLKGEELAQYNLWLDYLDALELVDTSGAPDIEWPTPPAVQAR
ncbi:tail fiber assembly protein [Escherichia coli]|nr:tail fiber assembly protein [Escherichia coli]